jgi:hypothetical protein
MRVETRETSRDPSSVPVIPGDFERMVCSQDDEIDGRYGGRNVTTGGRLDGNRKSMDIESGGRLHDGEEDEMLEDNASTRGARLGHEQKRPSINASSEHLDNQVTEHQVTEK